MNIKTTTHTHTHTHIYIYIYIYIYIDREKERDERERFEFSTLRKHHLKWPKAIILFHILLYLANIFMSVINGIFCSIYVNLIEAKEKRPAFQAGQEQEWSTQSGFKAKPLG